MNMEKLNLELLGKIECPSCFEYMTSKILMCKTGHSVCVSCLYKLRGECIMCKESITSCRNYNLEGIAELLKYPCTFTNCATYTSHKDFEEHIQNCSYRPYHCLLQSQETHCDWIGPRDKLLEHAFEDHPEKSWMKTENIDHWTKYVDDVEEVQLSVGFGEVFYVFRKCILTHANPKESVMYWGVLLVGDPEAASNFTYTVILSDNEDKTRITLKNICQPDTSTFLNIVKSGKCVGVPINVLETFMDEENIVSYILKIERYSQGDDDN